ncbi:hypothetical protein A3731_38880 [Roseovarius sp. HI0049]|nr:hypothetical protein A3731_25000 [Roseovarius sp. HI0049]KZY39252.1 hypothetical protein A3731_38880 [Roseovarius sp. HI0049]
MLRRPSPEAYELTAPTTVVFVTPAQAPTMTPAEIEGFYASQYAGAPDLSLEFVEGSGHYVMLDQPEQFSRLVAKFLN